MDAKTYAHNHMADTPLPGVPCTACDRELLATLRSAGVASGEVRQTSSTGGQKGTKPQRFDLIPAGPLRTLAELYGRGALKYDHRNWERGYKWSHSYAALNRHLWAFWGGEDLDNHTPDCPADCTNHTELPHLAAVAWHAFAMLEWSRTHPEFDDRPSTEAARPQPGATDDTWTDPRQG